MRKINIPYSANIAMEEETFLVKEFKLKFIVDQVSSIYTSSIDRTAPKILLFDNE